MTFLHEIISDISAEASPSSFLELHTKLPVSFRLTLLILWHNEKISYAETSSLSSLCQNMNFGFGLLIDVQHICVVSPSTGCTVPLTFILIDGLSENICAYVLLRCGAEKKYKSLHVVLYLNVYKCL